MEVILNEFQRLKMANRGSYINPCHNNETSILQLITNSVYIDYIKNVLN